MSRAILTKKFCGTTHVEIHVALKLPVKLVYFREREMLTSSRSQARSSRWQNSRNFIRNYD
jgi:hypothetical protein